MASVVVRRDCVPAGARPYLAAEFPEETRRLRPGIERRATTLPDEVARA